MNVAKILCVALLAVAVLGRVGPRWHQLSDSYTFSKYAADFGKRYEKEEWAMREGIFAARIRSVLAHNADATQSYKRGVNHFSDWTDAEWKSYNQATPDKAPKAKGMPPTHLPIQEFSATGLKLPKSVDYRNHNEPQVLTAVKNQGHCGSCWAHSAAESMESQWALLTGQTAVFSQGQINDCDNVNAGCGGGSFFYGWDYVSQTQGLYDAWAYPYTDFWAANTSKAATNKCQNIPDKYFPNWPWYPVANVTAMFVVKPNDAQSLMEALYVKGPVSISIAAGPIIDYEHGIFHNSNGTGAEKDFQLDHAVQAVGYGFDLDLQQPYWIVRNSWGTYWGEDGFVRLYRPAQEPCGFDQNFQVICGTVGMLSGPGFPQVAPLAVHKH